MPRIASTLLATLLAACFLTTLACGADEDKPPEQKVFNGKWNNQKYGTSGPLKCIARPAADGKVNATFSGTYKGDPFTYDVTFDTRPGRGKIDLAGKATVSGHLYEWTGALSGDTLTGKYTATSGYYGGFTLKETKSSE